jgi:type IV pilus biogenesis protein CpaD/CtpE
MHNAHKKLFIPAVIAAALTVVSLAGCASGGASYGSASPSASETAASAKLPASFPKSDVPIIDGTLLVARGDAGNGWSVTVQPQGKTGFADAKAALEKAGYTAAAGATDTKAVYTNGKYTVAVGTPGISVTYTVTAN